ncbi:MAG: LacI family DNA-binding transcriptional regulator [Planctomycetota bacterium]
MSVTQSDIASKLGVSQFVVSNALRNTDRVSAKTRQRVMEAVEALNYRPNSAARATREGRFGCINLLLSANEVRSALPPKLLFGIESALSAQSVDLTITRVPDEKLADSGYLPRFLCERNCDGVIVNYTDHCPEAFIRQIERNHLPCVWLNNKRDADCVYPDDHHAGELAANQLIERGFRDIVFIDYAHGDGQDPDTHYSSRDREAGYRGAIESHGLRLRIVRPPHNLPVADRLDYSRQWLRQEDRPEAVLCYSEADGMPFVMAAMSTGLKIPTDLFVGVISNRPITMPGYNMTLARVPEYDTGVAVAEALLKKISQPDVPLPPRAIAFKPSRPPPRQDDLVHPCFVHG